MTAKPSIKRILISVSDKEGLADLVTQLYQLGIKEIVATHGTASQLSQLNLPIISIKEVTDFPEIMDGRVKTLHPKIHAGLLGRRGIDDATMAAHQITPIDLLVVNLYPFKQTITQANCARSDAIEQIDIGGPAMIRAAAKNHDRVTVIVDPQDYAPVLAEIKNQGNTSSETRERLAQKAFAHTAEYDATIANYLSSSDLRTTQLSKKMSLRYGENPQQKADLYIENRIPNSLTEAEQKQGKPLSFNNLMDSDTALNCVRALDPSTAACVIVKHATPCGVAQANSLTKAYLMALATDPLSAFGGVIALNQRLDQKTADTIVEKQFVEVILAPEYSSEALGVLTSKKNLRVLQTGYGTHLNQHRSTFHSISGGLLIQDADEQPDIPSDFTVVTKRQPTANEMVDCLFGWQVVRYVKSNAIVYAKNRQTLGIGSGQTSRVFSATIATLKAREAGLSLQGACAASDAFYPFADGVEVAAEAGITAIIQPGGSKRDHEVVACADAKNIAMIFSGIRHFRH